MSGSAPNLPAIINLLLPIGRKYGWAKLATTKIAVVKKLKSKVLGRRFVSPPRIKLMTTAKNAELMAPIKIKAESLRSIPKRMRLPKPPAPIKAAKVAVPIIMTAAVRMPDIMTGIARAS